jgi:hypothetical protein
MIDHETFAVWFETHRDRDSRVAGYEHAMFMRWATERMLAQTTRERDGLLDVLAASTRENTDLRAQLAGVL